MSYSTHAILVNIPYAAESVGKSLSEMTKEEIKEMVIGYATEETECFAGRAFDYRELLNEEDHDDEEENNYPVLFASEDWNAFEAILLSKDRCQKDYAKGMLKYLKEEVGSTDLSVILNNLLLVNDRTASCESVDPNTWRWDFLNQGTWALREIARLIRGEYYSESGFYDTSRETALVPFIDTLKENPTDWALVQFDCHS